MRKGDVPGKAERESPIGERATRCEGGGWVRGRSELGEKGMREGEEECARANMRGEICPVS